MVYLSIYEIKDVKSGLLIFKLQKINSDLKFLHDGFGEFPENIIFKAIPIKKEDDRNYYYFCSDCVKIEIDYYNGFEHEKIILFDNQKDFQKLNQNLIEFEKILGIK